MLYPVLGVFKGRRITVHDVVMYSRAQHAIRRRRALAFVVAQLAASESSSRANRVVPRALGKWRGSSLAGYVFRGDEKTYKEKFRMPKAAFDKLLALLTGSGFDCALSHSDRSAALYATSGRRGSASRLRIRMVAARAATDPPCLKFKVATCMYIFARGGILEKVSDVASIGESTLRRWLHAFCAAIVEKLKPIYMPCKPFSKDERDAIQGQFASRRGLPNITLACDGTHTPFKPPNKKVALDYRNYKGWYSLLTVAFCDSFFRFFDIDVGYPGRAGDNTVLTRNWLMAAISADKDKWLGPSGVILGDSGASDGDEFFLNPYHAPTDPDRCWFNFCHSSTRFYIEQVFGIWKSRFRFLLNPCNTKHKLTVRMIYASAILHNFLIVHSRNSTTFDREMAADSWNSFFELYECMICPTCQRMKKTHCVHQAEYRNTVLHQQSVRKRPSTMRDELCSYLWNRVCNGDAFTNDEREHITTLMAERSNADVSMDSWNRV